MLPHNGHDNKNKRNREQFVKVVAMVEKALKDSPSPYFLEAFGTVDVIFTPYVERMNASLYYYKGYSLREENAGFGAWFDAMETRRLIGELKATFIPMFMIYPHKWEDVMIMGKSQRKINQSSG
jgi:glutathione S-transferase